MGRLFMLLVTFTETELLDEEGELLLDLLRKSFVGEKGDSEFECEVLHWNEFGHKGLEEERVDGILRVLVDYESFKERRSRIRLDFNELSREFFVREFHWFRNRSLCLSGFVLELEESRVNEVFKIREGRTRVREVLQRIVFYVPHAERFDARYDLIELCYAQAHLSLHNRFAAQLFSSGAPHGCW